jgi:dihydroflavonol-4-reductase
LITPSQSAGKGGPEAKRLLDWHPRSKEDALVATAESMLELGLLKDSKRAA